MPNCPECGTALTLGEDTMANEIVECAACGVELEVLSVNPIEIALAPEEEEDWGE